MKYMRVIFTHISPLVGGPARKALPSVPIVEDRSISRDEHKLLSVIDAGWCSCFRGTNKFDSDDGVITIKCKVTRLEFGLVPFSGYASRTSGINV